MSDGLGSAEEALTTSGTVSASRLYTPYGSSRYSSGTFPTDQGFTGYLADSATGLDYANARYYDPAAGQFGSADPTSGSGFNRFGYVGGSPETATDPSGLELMVGDPQNGAGPATAIPGAALAGMVALVILFFEGVSKRVVNSYQAITTKPSITAPTEQVGGVTDTVNGPTIQADRNAAQAAAAAAVVGGVTDVVNGPLLQALRLANTPTTPTTPTPTPTPSTPTVTPATTEEPVAQPATSGAGATAGGGNGCSGGGGDGGSNATDTTRTYVIGEDMKNRVIPYAQARGYYYWKIRANATTDGMTRDQRWIWWLMRQGYRIVDIGRAPDRLAQGLPGSKYYDMELNTIARGNYGNFYRDKNPGC